jgi:DNA-binding LytR/AlgR family response regulator
VTRDGAKRTVTVQLGVIEDLLNRQLRSKDDEFMRIGKSLIVNLNFVHYINPAKKQIVLSDSHTFSHSLEASKEALKQLKDFFENNVKK